LTPGGEVKGKRVVNTRLLLAVVVSAILISVLNQTFTNVVVPDIQRDYGVSQGQAGWVITGYLLVFAVGIPLYGRIADLYSLRRVFSLGLLVLAIGSLVCALAPTLPILVAGRIVQAAGAAAIPALGFASVAKALPPGERGMALGLLSSSVGIGAVVGPVVGGFVAGFTGWHVLFFLTLVLGLVLIPPALRVLPGAAEKGGAPTGFLAALHRFDVPGGLSLALAAGFALFGVTEGQVLGFGSPVVWGSFALAVAAAVFFGWRIRHAPEPFVSPGLFRNRAFVAAAVVGFFMMFANVGGLVLAPLLLSEVNGLSAAGIGLVLAPGAAAVAVLSPVAGRLSDRFGSRLLVRVGLVVFAVSTLFISTVSVGDSPVVVAAGLLGQGLGFAAINSPNANAAAAVLSRAESGVGLGIYQMLFFLGAGFGPAIGATFLALRQNSGAGALNPLYAADAAAYSDAFLLLAVAALISLVASSGLREKIKGGEDLPEGVPRAPGER
jgi:MFS transporter, DHA2 family, metal-tetracycline-proton antiporter